VNGQAGPLQAVSLDAQDDAGTIAHDGRMFARAAKIDPIHIPPDIASSDDAIRDQ
jgi:hypothetical protein